jgi:hypothetical protein
MFETTFKKAPLIEGTFEELWAQRTIVLKPVESKQLRRNHDSMMGSGPEQMEPVAHSDDLSFTVRATLMDSALTEAGLQQFAQLNAMQENEFQEFRERYYASHNMGDTTFIWLQLETTLSQRYLELDLWDFSLIVAEDKKNIEPIRVEEYAIERRTQSHRPPKINALFSLPEANGSGIGYAAKGIELYFVNKGDKNKTKLLVSRQLNPDIQVEGRWSNQSKH